MLQLVRLVTVHPALVHFTLGSIPVILVAYAVAAWRRSPAWTLVGDVALGVTAVITLFTAAFGLVSNAALFWPGGMARWRWIHLGFGVATTVLLVGFALWRLAQRRLRAGTGYGTAAFSALLALVVLVTGWVGGEVLVFHSGMAVRGAGNGVLALPVSRRTPRDLNDAMGELRAGWAQAQTALAEMIADQPTPARFDAVARGAGRARAISEWVAREGARTLPAPGGAVPTGQTEQVAGHEHEEGGHPHEAGMSRADHLREMATSLVQHAGELEEAARRRDLRDVNRAARQVDMMCISCHEELRWTPPGP